MSIKGAKLSFTAHEKLAFNPLFLKYVQKEYSEKDILTALGGDPQKHARFQLYAEGLLAVMKLKRQGKAGEVAALQKSKTLLTQSIQRKEAAIEKSRMSTVEEVLRNSKIPVRV
ncbi:MAG: hypothetical protein AB7I18_12735 [Candidatus Berkiella sp.]